MFHKRNDRETAYTDNVIIDEKRVSVGQLKKKAKRANRTFWALCVSFSMLSMLLLPYMSMAAVVATSDSDAFTGNVIPGYSMGGVELAAYGVDINKWGQVSSDTAVRSNYGVWSGTRGTNAVSSAQSAISTRSSSNNNQNSNIELSATEKASGWQAITGKSAYSRDDPDGTEGNNQSNYYDTVSPYRTTSDWTYWNKYQAKSGDNASADVTVDLCPDFIVVGIEDGHATVLESPDSIETTKDGTTSYLSDGATMGGDTYHHSTQTSATPYYVSLKDLFDGYNLTAPNEATISNLMNVIGKTDPTGTKLAEIAERSSLLKSTSYVPLNNSSGNSSSEAFNPYPYSMVFSAEDNGATVTSSIYGAEECYVYFSPSSVYTKYLTVKQEYESIKQSSSTSISNNDSVKTFQLGYYAATLAILEAYLEEALPQDMSRGYVGMSETTAGNLITNDEKGKGTHGNYDGWNIRDTVAYGQLMYDVAQKIGDETRNSDTNYDINDTNAIMDTLSVFGYSWKNNDERGNSREGELGIMHGYDADKNQTRLTALTPYSTEEDRSSDDGLSGVYTPPYYPIQQHLMPNSERTYRFQILATVPYNVLTTLIKYKGFSSSAYFTYSSAEADQNFTITNDILNDQNALAKLQNLANQMQNTNGKKSEGATLAEVASGGTVNGNLLSITGQNTNTNGIDEKIQKTATRIDNALTGYNSSTMTADNVRDMTVIMRATNFLKLETWYRYYNPIKSQGGDSDVFVTRVTPAKTTYFPEPLIGGYLSAGETQLSSNYKTEACSHDYFSIPSFAPCFASHTISNCYYGSLNYELKAFYSSDFLKGVSSTVPAVSALQKYQETINSANSDSSNEQTITWKNLATLYIMAKKLAYIETILDFTEEKVSFTGNTLINYFSNTSGFNYSSMLDAAYNNTDGYMKYEDRFQSRSLLHLSNGLDANKALRVNHTKTENVKTEGSDLIVFSSKNNDTYGILSQNTGMVPFAINDDQRLKLMTSDSTDQFGDSYVDSAFLFTIEYDKNFADLLEENGTYYWMDYTKIKNKIQEDSSLVEKSDNAYVSKEEYNKYTVSFDGGILARALPGIFKGKKAEDIISEYQNKIEEANNEITTAVQNLAKDIQNLKASLPTQMQNCLAWGDYQNATDSENQYQTDPSDTNVVVNMSQATNTDNSNKSYLSASAASSAGVKAEESADGIKLTGTLSDDDSSMESRMVRGVEGSTWTSTQQPAEYTITATTGRISALASNTGTTYPYSGIANGRLQSGTDQYSILQAHVIDYTSIESGIAGDLATRQRASLVKVTSPEYSSITDFLNNLGNLGAMFGEIGKTIISGSAGIFSSVFFSDNDNVSSQATVDSVNAHAATMNYTTSDGITMDRVPASAYKFNTSTGKLETQRMQNGDTQYVTTAATANAAMGSRNNLTSNVSTLFLYSGAGLYSIIQTLGLILVMSFLFYIAFKNMYAYAVANNVKLLTAQTQLKRVLPRSVIAIFMIGLPPIGNGVGFEGGNFLLLEIINNIVTFISDIFWNLNSSAIVNTITSISSPSGDIGMYICYFFCALIIAACFIIGAVIVIVQQLVLLVFYLIGPIAWSFYVWPYSYEIKGEDDSTQEYNNFGRISGITQNLTKRLSFGFFTGRRAGDLAPGGLIIQYTLISTVTIMWALIFWVMSMLISTLALGGSEATGATTASASSLTISSTGYPTASADVLSNLVDMFGNSAGTGTGSGPNVVTGVNMIFAALLCVLLFVVMGKVMLDALGSATQIGASCFGKLGQAIKDKAFEKMTGEKDMEELEGAKNDKDIEERIKQMRARGEKAKADRIEQRLTKNGGLNVDTAKKIRNRTNMLKGANALLNNAASGGSPVTMASDVAALTSKAMNDKKRQGLDDKLNMNKKALASIKDLKTLDPKDVDKYVNGLPDEMRALLSKNGAIINENGKWHSNDLDGAVNKIYDDNADIFEKKSLMDKEERIVKSIGANKEDGRKNLGIKNSDKAVKSREALNKAGDNIDLKPLTDGELEERENIREYVALHPDLDLSTIDLGTRNGLVAAKTLVNDYETTSKFGDFKALNSEEKDREKQIDNVLADAGNMAIKLEKFARSKGVNPRTPQGLTMLKDTLESLQSVGDNILTAGDYRELAAAANKRELTMDEQKKLATTKAFFDATGQEILPVTASTRTTSDAINEMALETKEDLHNALTSNKHSLQGFGNSKNMINNIGDGWTELDTDKADDTVRALNSMFGNDGLINDFIIDQIAAGVPLSDIMARMVVDGLSDGDNKILLTDLAQKMKNLPKEESKVTSMIREAMKRNDPSYVTADNQVKRYEPFVTNANNKSKYNKAMNLLRAKGFSASSPDGIKFLEGLGNCTVEKDGKTETMSVADLVAQYNFNDAAYKRALSDRATSLSTINSKLTGLDFKRIMNISNSTVAGAISMASQFDDIDKIARHSEMTETINTIPAATEIIANAAFSGMNKGIVNDKAQQAFENVITSKSMSPNDCLEQIKNWRDGTDTLPAGLCDKDLDIIESSFRLSMQNIPQDALSKCDTVLRAKGFTSDEIKNYSDYDAKSVIGSLGNKTDNIIYKRLGKNESSTTTAVRVISEKCAQLQAQRTEDIKRRGTTSLPNITTNDLSEEQVSAFYHGIKRSCTPKRAYLDMNKVHISNDKNKYSKYLRHTYRMASNEAETYLAFERDATLEGATTDAEFRSILATRVSSPAQMKSFISLKHTLDASSTSVRDDLLKYYNDAYVLGFFTPDASQREELESVLEQKEREHRLRDARMKTNISMGKTMITDATIPTPPPLPKPTKKPTK